MSHLFPIQYLKSKLEDRMEQNNENSKVRMFYANKLSNGLPLYQQLNYKKGLNYMTISGQVGFPPQDLEAHDNQVVDVQLNFDLYKELKVKDGETLIGTVIGNLEGPLKNNIVNYNFTLASEYIEGTFPAQYIYKPEIRLIFNIHTLGQFEFFYNVTISKTQV